MRFNDARRIFSRPTINGFIDTKYTNVLPLRIFNTHQMIRALNTSFLFDSF